MHLHKRIHEATREIYFQYVEWSPPASYPTKIVNGLRGAPLLELRVFHDRIELYRAWCFSSGHMETYEDELERIIHCESGLWPEHTWTALTERFGEEISEEVKALSGASFV